MRLSALLANTEDFCVATYHAAKDAYKAAQAAKEAQRLVQLAETLKQNPELRKQLGL